MKTSVGVPQFLASLLFAALVTACTSSAPNTLEVPTLASLSEASTTPAAATALPTITPVDTATPDTGLITREAELSNTQVAVGATQTALSVQALAQPTQDCGALEWWNYAGGSAIDFMRTLAEYNAVLLPFEANPTESYDAFSIGSAYADALDSLSNDVAKRDYPLCIKAGRDALVGAMEAYHTYALERALSLTPNPSPQYSPQKLSEVLAQARELMRAAAAEIQRVIGEDTSVLLNDGISMNATQSIILTPTEVGLDKTLTAMPTPSPTITPTFAPISHRFALQNGRAIYLTNPTARGGCNWSSVAGSVVLADGTAGNDYSVRVTGVGVDQTVNTGSAPGFGPGGFEVPLGSIAIEGRFVVQLLDPQGRDVSPAYTVETSSDCNVNIAAVRFVEVAQSG